MIDPAKPFWFLSSEVTVKVPAARGADGISVMLFRQPEGDAPPLHVHRTEDEIFHVLGGEVRFSVDGTETVARAGDTVLGPRGLPHGYRVLSPLSEMLIITRGAFERMVRRMGRPAEAAGPPPLSVPDEASQRALFAACAAEGIDLIGPPIA